MTPDRVKLAEALVLLEELTGEVADWVEHYYKETKDHGLRRQYERDMEPVHRARAFLAATWQDEEPGW